MDSIREQILAAFATKIGASRSLRNVELALYDNDGEPIDDDQPGFDAIFKTLPARVEYQRKLTEAELDTASTILNNKIAEIVKAATEGDRTLGGLCDETKEQEHSWELRDPGSRTVAASILFFIHYHYDRGDPFTKQ